MLIVGMVALHAFREAKRLGLPIGLAYILDMLLPVIKLRGLHYSDKFDLLNHRARWYFYVH
ncbi:MAG: hypothetical protein OEZ32_02390 [Nitrospinota bacterium]|nr:hypothetical protein [Nitrospinota bacterium]